MVKVMVKGIIEKPHFLFSEALSSRYGLYGLLKHIDIIVAVYLFHLGIFAVLFGRISQLREMEVACV